MKAKGKKYGDSSGMKMSTGMATNSVAWNMGKFGKGSVKGPDFFPKSPGRKAQSPRKTKGQ
jgi:hypothetical protein